MSAPMDYTGLTISLAPHDLTAAAAEIVGTDTKTIGGWIGDIVQSLKKIDDALKGLKLSWAGNTAAEVEAFSTRLQGATQMMFGGSGDAVDGSVSRLAMAIGVSGNNYNAAEDGINKILNEMISAFQPSTSPSDNTAYIPPPSSETTLPWQGAVSEIF